MEHRTHLQEMEQALLAAPRRTVTSGSAWAADVPELAGVYAIWDRKKGCIVYVGETSDLKLRLGDLGRYFNHTFRRFASRELGIDRRAGEAALSAAMAMRFEIAVLSLSWGRKELEEYLVLRYRSTLCNKPAKRLVNGDQYQWVTAV